MAMQAKWEELYYAAILETDDRKLPSRIEAAEAAIDLQSRAMSLDHGGARDERHAIHDALDGLNELRSQLKERTNNQG